MDLNDILPKSNIVEFTIPLQESVKIPLQTEQSNAYPISIVTDSPPPKEHISIIELPDTTLFQSLDLKLDTPFHINSKYKFYKCTKILEIQNLLDKYISTKKLGTTYDEKVNTTTHNAYVLDIPSEIDIKYNNINARRSNIIKINSNNVKLFKGNSVQNAVDLCTLLKDPPFSKYVLGVDKLGASGSFIYKICPKIDVDTLCKSSKEHNNIGIKIIPYKSSSEESSKECLTKNSPQIAEINIIRLLERFVIDKNTPHIILPIKTFTCDTIKILSELFSAEFNKLNKNPPNLSDMTQLYEQYSTELLNLYKTSRIEVFTTETTLELEAKLDDISKQIQKIKKNPPPPDLSALSDLYKTFTNELFHLYETIDNELVHLYEKHLDELVQKLQDKLNNISKTIQIIKIWKCNKSEVLISEWANGGTLDSYCNYINKKDMDENEKTMIYKVLLFQILFTLAIICEKYPNFRHNDLHLENILISTWEKSDNYYLYNYNGTYYKIPDVGFQIKFWDYDWSCNSGPLNNPDNIINTKSTKITSVKSGIACTENQYYDIHRVLANIFYSLTSIPETIKKFLQKYIRYGLNNVTKIVYINKGLKEHITFESDDTRIHLHVHQPQSDEQLCKLDIVEKDKYYNIYTYIKCQKILQLMKTNDDITAKSILNDEVGKDEFENDLFFNEFVISREVAMKGDYIDKYNMPLSTS